MRNPLHTKADIQALLLTKQMLSVAKKGVENGDFTWQITGTGNAFGEISTPDRKRVFQFVISRETPAEQWKVHMSKAIALQSKSHLSDDQAAALQASIPMQTKA